RPDEIGALAQLSQHRTEGPVQIPAEGHYPFQTVPGGSTQLLFHPAKGRREASQVLCRVVPSPEHATEAARVDLVRALEPALVPVVDNVLPVDPIQREV